MTRTIRGNPLVVLLVVLLTMTACAASRSQTSQISEQESTTDRTQEIANERFDSLAAQFRLRNENQTETNRTLLMVAEGVPGQTAQLTIPIGNLRNLPEGAKYSAQNGRASVEAERKGDQVVVTGKADSIARRCLYFENQVFRQRQTIDSLGQLLVAERAANMLLQYQASARSGTTQRIETSRKPSSAWHWWLLTGFLAGGAAAAWLTKTNPLKVIFSFIKKIV